MFYAQNSEDEIIHEYFWSDVQKKMTQFNLLSLGENDGKTYSNALSLIEFGWKAVLVEPSPTAFTKLCKLHAKREGVYCYEKAVGSFNGKVILHDSGTHLNRGDTSLVSTIKPEEKSRWVNEKFTEVEVDCVTFETLLSLCTIKQFDFITMDIEGMEKEVLPQMDLKALGCKIICIEHNSNVDIKKFIIDYCSKYGLNKIILDNAENIIICK